MKKISSIRITISIPTFNRLELLKRTLASVFSQTEAPDEIIVVDNNSDDGTWMYLKSLKGIKIYRNKKNIGAVENYNRSIKLATSEYVVSLASDDILLPEYIKIAKRKISKAEEGVAAFTFAGYIIDKNDRVRAIVKPFPQDMLFRPPKTVKLFWDHYYFQIPLSGWTVYKKEIFNTVGFFTDKYVRNIEEEMSMKIFPRFPIYFVSTPLFSCRHHSLQAFDYKIGDTNPDRGFQDKINGTRVMVDYENDSSIKYSFSHKEQGERIFIRKITVFFLFASLYFLLIGDLKRCLKHFRIFKTYHPKPYLSFLTAELLFRWLFESFKRNIRNIIIRRNFKNRSIIEYYNIKV